MRQGAYNPIANRVVALASRSVRRRQMRKDFSRTLYEGRGAQPARIRTASSRSERRASPLSIPKSPSPSPPPLAKLPAAGWGDHIHDRHTAPKREKRHIVICCDGTGNEISENISNVLKLYRTLRKTEKTQPNQLVFYDPGVGTLARPNPWLKWRQDSAAIFGLATGYGLDDNILNSYEFIVDNYQPRATTSICSAFPAAPTPCARWRG